MEWLEKYGKLMHRSKLRDMRARVTLTCVCVAARVKWHGIFRDCIKSTLYVDRRAIYGVQLESSSDKSVIFDNGEKVFAEILHIYHAALSRPVD
jgi:hypothetical protein